MGIRYFTILFFLHGLASYPCSSHSQVTIELPYVLVQTLIYGLIVYAMIGFEWTGSKFFWYMFIMYFTLLYFTYYGMMSVAMTPDHNIAAIISVAFYCIWNLFSGFLIPRPVTKQELSPVNASWLFSLIYNRVISNTSKDFHLRSLIEILNLLNIWPF